MADTPNINKLLIKIGSLLSYLDMEKLPQYSRDKVDKIIISAVNAKDELVLNELKTSIAYLQHLCLTQQISEVNAKLDKIIDRIKECE